MELRTGLRRRGRGGGCVRLSGRAGARRLLLDDLSSEERQGRRCGSSGQVDDRDRRRPDHADRYGGGDLLLYSRRRYLRRSRAFRTVVRRGFARSDSERLQRKCACSFRTRRPSGGPEVERPLQSVLCRRSGRRTQTRIERELSERAPAGDALSARRPDSHGGLPAVGRVARILRGAVRGVEVELLRRCVRRLPATDGEPRRRAAGTRFLARDDPGRNDCQGRFRGRLRAVLPLGDVSRFDPDRRAGARSLCGLQGSGAAYGGSDRVGRYDPARVRGAARRRECGRDAFRAGRNAGARVARDRG